MPILVKPSNDASRLNLITMCISTGKSDYKSGKAYLSINTLDRSIAVSEEFNVKIKAEAGTIASRSKEVREKNQALGILEVYIRDMWEGLKRRVYRNNEPAEVLTYYQLPLDGTVPKVIIEKEIFALASKIIEGERKAVAAGYSAAVNPSVAELTKILEAAKKEAEEVAQADRQYDSAQKALGPIREKADELITDIIAELEYNLHRLDPSNRRRIMRSYGVTYKYAKGEPEEETTPAAQAAN